MEAKLDQRRNGSHPPEAVGKANPVVARPEKRADRAEEEDRCGFANAAGYIVAVYHGKTSAPK
jgi:hypothetical protein